MTAVAFLTLVAFISIGSDGVLAADGACPSGERKTEQGCRRDPQIVSKVPTTYPAEARSRGVTGSVTLEGVIGEAGTVSGVKVVKTTASSVKYRKDFEQAAVESFQGWRYSPATLNGKPVATPMTVTIEFSL
jgi:TonB family protein